MPQRSHEEGYDAKRIWFPEITTGPSVMRDEGVRISETQIHRSCTALFGRMLRQEWATVRPALARWNFVAEGVYLKLT